jgi:hypothetical protein
MQGIGSISGTIAEDIATIANLTVPAQSFIAANDITPEFDRTPPSGLIGTFSRVGLHSFLRLNGRDGLWHLVRLAEAYLVRESDASTQRCGATIRNLSDGQRSFRLLGESLVALYFYDYDNMYYASSAVHWLRRC